MVQAVAMALREVRDVFVENISADNTCTFAFPSMVLLPAIRVECFVAILNDRVIVAWRKGLFRKKTVSRVIPKHTIKSDEPILIDGMQFEDLKGKFPVPVHEMDLKDFLGFILNAAKN